MDSPANALTQSHLTAHRFTFTFNHSDAFWMCVCALSKREQQNGVPSVFVGIGEGISKKALKGLKGQTPFV